MAGYTRVSQVGLQRARAGKVMNKWVNEKVPGAGVKILDDTNLIYNLQEGKQIVICGWAYGVITNSDDSHFCIGYTDQPDAAGTFTAVTHCFYAGTGAANDSVRMYNVQCGVPIVLKYSEGVRCITIRTEANDANCEITVGWWGWTEEEALYPGDF